jgi:phage tail-like protein
MMRGEVPGAPTSVLVIEQMPSIFQDDLFTREFTSAFDSVLAPVFGVLDSLEAYIDPKLAPVDFLEWLAGWVGLAIDEDWPIDRQRTFVSEAVSVYRLRGTAVGLRAEVEIYTQGTVDVIESGACAWSQTPNAAPPGSAPSTVTVRVAVANPGSVNAAGLEAIVAGAKPAHVVHRIEVVAAR